MRAPSTGNPHYPQGPGAVAAVVTPVLAPFPPSTPQVPVSSFRLPERVERPEKGVVRFEFLADSTFAQEGPHQEVPTYAEAATSAQLIAYDAWAEREYQSDRDGWRNYINATKAERVLWGSMEWIMSEEWWFLVDVEEMAMDPRR